MVWLQAQRGEQEPGGAADSPGACDGPEAAGETRERAEAEDPSLGWADLAEVSGALWRCLGLWFAVLLLPGRPLTHTLRLWLPLPLCVCLSRALSLSLSLSLSPSPLSLSLPPSLSFSLFLPLSPPHPLRSTAAGF